MEYSGLCWGDGEQGKSVKGNWYYQVLQMGKGERDASPAIVTAGMDMSGGMVGWLLIFACWHMAHPRT